MSDLLDLWKQKYFANRGVKRNKTRLPNLRIKVDIFKELKNSDDELLERFKPFKFKELGYISVCWTKELDRKGEEPIWNLDSSVTVERLKEVLGEKQWSKFCQGKRFFIIQRRVNGKNI